MKAIRGIAINNEVHTARDLDLLLLRSESAAENPAPRRLTESIPGRNGLLDYSGYYDGVIFYDEREISYKFFCGGSPREVREAADALKRWHGRKITVVEDDDPDYSVTGWATVSEDERSPLGNYLYLTLKLDAEPFRIRLRPTVLQFPAITGTSSYDVRNSVMPARLSVTGNSMSAGGGSSTPALLISTASTQNSMLITTVGTAVTVDRFLLKGGAQRLIFETGLLAGTDFHYYAAGAANVTVSFTEGKF